MSEALFGCMVSECASEVSYPADMLKDWNGEPVCENCYDSGTDSDAPRWHELPDFIPDEQKQIKQLTIDLEIARARNDELLGAIGSITAQAIGRGNGECSVPSDAIVRAEKLTTTTPESSGFSKQEKTNHE